MTENKKIMVFSDIDASITRLLHGLNYDNFQKQQDFLKSIKGNQETNNIVNGILDLLDRVADLYENTTGKSLTNRFETIDNYIELLLQLENATDMEYTISEFIFHASGNSNFIVTKIWFHAKIYKSTLFFIVNHLIFLLYITLLLPFLLE